MKSINSVEYVIISKHSHSYIHRAQSIYACHNIITQIVMLSVDVTDFFCVYVYNGVLKTKNGP